MAVAEVTVIVPTCNRRTLVTETVATITGQLGVDVHVLVVDDASTDGTADVLESTFGSAVTVLRQSRRRGPAAARNAGLLSAPTRWIAFCDDDDLWAPDKLHRQLAVLTAEDSVWSATSSVSIDPNRRIVGHQRVAPPGATRRLLQAHNVIPGGCSSVVARRDAVIDAGGFDETLSSCEDYDLWCWLTRTTPPAAVDEPLVAYRVGAGSRSTRTADVRAAIDEIHRRYQHDLTPEEQRCGDLLDAQYLARFPLRAHQRVDATLAYLDIALRYRLPGHAGLAAAALLAPRTAERRRAADELAKVPASWLATASRWLAPVPHAPLPQVDPSPRPPTSSRIPTGGPPIVGNAAAL